MRTERRDIANWLYFQIYFRKEPLQKHIEPPSPQNDPNWRAEVAKNLNFFYWGWMNITIVLLGMNEYHNFFIGDE